MNNKGFAITTILYGLLILFCFLLVSLLGILSTYRGNLEKLIENTNGSRNAVTMGENHDYSSFEALKDDKNAKRGLYCFGDDPCVYVSNGDLK